MCAFGGGSKSSQPVKNIVSQPTALPEKAPEPVEIKKDKAPRENRRRNPLRIELAQQAAASANTGVNV
jgi:hypothetical protein